MKKKEIRRTILSVLGAVLGFVIIYRGLGVPPMVSGLLAIGLYFGLYLLLKPSVKIGNTEMGEDGALFADMMENCRSCMKDLEKSLPSIIDEEIKTDLRQLIDTGHQILAYLEKHPDRIGGTGHLDYYMRTASQLVHKYLALRTADSDSPDFIQTRQQMRDGLKLLVKAFRKMQQTLLAGDRLDLETDIDVLKTMTKTEEDQL